MNFTIQVKDLGIKINENVCWRCGSTKEITNHHAIDVYLKPIKNVEIPLCRKCHSDLHGQDMNNLSAFAYKIMKTVKQSDKHIKALTQLINRKKNTNKQITNKTPVIKDEKRGKNEQNIKQNPNC